MKHRHYILFELSLVIFALLFSTSLYAQTGMAYNSIYIPKKYVKDNTKPTLVMLTATWCGPCRSMKSKVMKEQPVKAILEKMNVLYIDIETNDGKIYSDRFKRAGYKGSIPFFAILDTEGNILGTSTGYMSSKSFSGFLERTTIADL